MHKHKRGRASVLERIFSKKEDEEKLFKKFASVSDQVESEEKEDDEKVLDEIKSLFLNRERKELKKLILLFEREKKMIKNLFDFVSTNLKRNGKGNSSSISAEEFLLIVKQSIYQKVSEESSLAGGLINMYELKLMTADSTALIDQFSAVTRTHPELFKRFLSLVEDLDRTAKSFAKKAEDENVKGIPVGLLKKAVRIVKSPDGNGENLAFVPVIVKNLEEKIREVEGKTRRNESVGNKGNKKGIRTRCG